MTNKEVSSVLSRLAALMELHKGNEFKIRSVQNAAFTVNRLDVPVSTLSLEEREGIKGIGKSINQKISEILDTGSLPELDDLVQQTPGGVIEMLDIKGIGPRKVAMLWKELGIESPFELLYACNENRLTELKGFGSKTQQQIKKSVEYSISNSGLFHFATLEEAATRLKNRLNKLKEIELLEITGDLRRKCETAGHIRLVAAVKDVERVSDYILKSKEWQDLEFIPMEDHSLQGMLDSAFPVHLEFTRPADFYKTLFKTTGNPEHLTLWSKQAGVDLHKLPSLNTEEDYYVSFNIQFIEPELREGGDELELAHGNKIPQLISLSDLKGCLHNHSTYSDGVNSIEEMSKACVELGLSYFGICDHSKSAFYANGMPEERIIQQHREVDELNKKMAPFRIFKGIECDILHDGSLDYSDEVLKSFDFVIASIHSGLRMTSEKATERILKAIRHPATTILGHPTGRLLLAREGYPLDHRTVIDACAENGVVIELNAHPYRLDLDWRWIRYATSKNVMISINPDAHHVDGISDMAYGVLAARKGMLTARHCFNALDAQQISEWFVARKHRFAGLSA
jgi:DNA polymerase (family X)